LDLFSNAVSRLKINNSNYFINYVAFKKILTHQTTVEIVKVLSSTLLSIQLLPKDVKLALKLCWCKPISAENCERSFSTAHEAKKLSASKAWLKNIWPNFHYFLVLMHWEKIDIGIDLRWRWLILTQSIL
jgi:hypothetical protein